MFIYFLLFHKYFTLTAGEKLLKNSDLIFLMNLALTLKIWFSVKYPGQKKKANKYITLVVRWFFAFFRPPRLAPAICGRIWTSVQMSMWSLINKTYKPINLKKQWTGIPEEGGREGDLHWHGVARWRRIWRKGGRSGATLSGWPKTVQDAVADLGRVRGVRSNA